MAFGDIVILTAHTTSNSIDTQLFQAGAGETYYIQDFFASALATSNFPDSNYSLYTQLTVANNLGTLDTRTLSSGDWNDDATGWRTDRLLPDEYISDGETLHFQANDNEGLLDDMECLVILRQIQS